VNAPRAARAFLVAVGALVLVATEGTPAAQTAEIIVDITTTGTTLRANHLKMLGDGLILRSETCLVASRAAPVSPTSQAATAAIRDRIAAG
jgi:ATP phosphoribosyltransferase